MTVFSPSPKPEFVTNTSEYLEGELARLQSVIDESDAAFRSLVDAFDEKERYIDSLPSVRAKRWILGRLPHGET